MARDRQQPRTQTARAQLTYPVDLDYVLGGRLECCCVMYRYTRDGAFFPDTATVATHHIRKKNPTEKRIVYVRIAKLKMMKNKLRM